MGWHLEHTLYVHCDTCINRRLFQATALETARREAELAGWKLGTGNTSAFCPACILQSGRKETGDER